MPRFRVVKTYEVETVNELFAWEAVEAPAGDQYLLWYSVRPVKPRKKRAQAKPKAHPTKK